MEKHRQDSVFRALPHHIFLYGGGDKSQVFNDKTGSIIKDDAVVYILPSCDCFIFSFYGFYSWSHQINAVIGMVIRTSLSGSVTIIKNKISGYVNDDITF